MAENTFLGFGVSFVVFFVLFFFVWGGFLVSEVTHYVQPGKEKQLKF